MNQSVVNHSCVFAAQSDSRIAQQESPTLAVTPAQTYGNHSKRLKCIKSLLSLKIGVKRPAILHPLTGKRSTRINHLRVSRVA
jgi:hypothetical protein